MPAIAYQQQQSQLATVAGNRGRLFEGVSSTITNAVIRHLVSFDLNAVKESAEVSYQAPQGRIARVDTTNYAIAELDSFTSKGTPLKRTIGLG